MSDLERRKTDHLDLCAKGDVAFRETSTLFECIRLVHDALPELAYGEVDPSVLVLGKRLKAPLQIAGMTGGTPRAERINRELARLAEKRGIGFGLGSQRAMLVDPECARTYQVRDVAPSTLILGNIGIVQAKAAQDDVLARLVAEVGADALCVHMNPAMELIQQDGDRDFRGGAQRLAELVDRLPVPIVAKETGCGVSGQVALKLHSAGVRHVDVSGAGGTSWVAVETQRADPTRRSLGLRLWDWGIPTAASVALVSPVGFETVIATGGIQSGMDVAKALALGANIAGIARPVLQAFEAGGPEAAEAFLESVELELRTVMLLVGARTTEELRRTPRVLSGELAAWLRQA